MNLIINSSNSFEIVDGLIKSNKNFDVEKKENSLIISSGNNISICFFIKLPRPQEQGFLTEPFL